VIIATQTVQASGLAHQAGSSLSAFGLTDEQFEDKVKGYLGTPYRSGGTSRDGMDCSGFVKTVYDRFFGIDLPGSARAQFGFSELKKINSCEIQPGDLIFFANSKKKRINHVGMYISEGQFIHASSTQGITVSSLDDSYWKKRLVGSKRHTVMNSTPDTDQIRFESSVKIPVKQKGSISAYTRDDIRFNSLAMEKDPNAIDDSYFENHDLNYSSLAFYEIGYDHTLFDGFDVSFSASHEEFDILALSPGFDSSTWNGNDLFDDSLPDTGERLGFKLTSALKPSNWFSITPSITYFDYPSENEDLLNVPDWSLGLNTSLSPIHKQWSLSMLLQYSKGEDLTALKAPDSRFSSMDMEINLWINLTEKLQFSIMGQHDIRTSASGTNDSLFIQSPSSNLLMMFHCNY